MKQTILYMLLPILALLLTACDPESDNTVPDAPSAEGLRIQAVKLGFLEEDGKTRTTTDDATMTTTFETGDAIGIFAVKDGVVADDCKNLKLTLQADGSWGGNTINFLDGTTYFAYSPYRDVEAINLAKTLDEIGAGFEVSYIQNTKELYAANDLMTSVTCTVDKEAKSLTIAFEHALALLEVGPFYCQSGNLKYAIKGSVLDDITLMPQGQKVSGLSTTNYVLGTSPPKRYLLKPATYSVSCTFFLKSGSGSAMIYDVYTDWSNGSEFIGVKGKRVKFKPYQVRPIKMGDYFYSDGSIYPSGQARPFTKDQGCIGVVFFAGAGSGDDIGKYSDTGIQGSIHGYVVALEDVKSGATLRWADTNNALFSGGGTSTNENDYLGYANSQAMKQTEISVGLCSFPACDEAMRFSPYPPPNCSNWYLPSAGQLKSIGSNKSVIENALTNVGGHSFQPEVYWSSTEVTLPEGYARYYNFAKNELSYGPKYATFSRARSIFTF